ncbi:MAG: hypothetical protein PHT02_01625 [Tissierellia bacterium]|nr:hypothetical protein [Tissierellia bacterium]
MDYDNSNSGDTAPNLITKSKLNEIKIRKDGQSRLHEIISENLDNNSIIQRENTKIQDKKIVNNKPSQFGPILGVNFHNVKR